MGKNNYQIIANQLSLAAGATAVIDLDLQDIVNLQLGIRVQYAATASATGLTLNMKSGFGDSDPGMGFFYLVGGSSVPKYDKVGENKTLNTITPSSGSAQDVETVINVLVDDIPRWLRLTFVNLDASNAATLTIYADL